MYAAIGSCPRCGAPRWCPSPWNAVTPPPSYPTCTCMATPLETRPPTFTLTDPIAGASFIAEFLRKQSELAAKNCRLNQLTRTELLEQVAQKIDEYWIQCIHCRAGIDNKPCAKCVQDREILQDAARAVRELKSV